MKTKSVTILAIAAILLSAGAILAQQGTGPGQGPRPGERIVRFLGLTPDQLTQWNAIHEEMQALVAPLREQRQANRAGIQAELNLPAPNPTRIGDLVIANHNLREQQSQLREQTHAKLMAILTPEQQVKFQQMLERRGGRGRGGCDGLGQGPGSGPKFGRGPGGNQ